jgi:hypothetical protein
MVVNNLKLGILDKFYVGILVFIFALIILHAPIIVVFSTLFPSPSLDIYIKSWKEVLMGIALIAAVVLLIRKKKLGLLKDKIIILMGVYALLHLLLIPIFWQGIKPTFAGLLIDLRYILFFGLVYIAVQLYPHLRKIFVKFFTGGALVVVVFAILQVFILPRDILAYIGYNKDTIIPYLFVDANEHFVRINSTLRGPNPLGAYAGIVLAFVVALVLKTDYLKRRRNKIIAAVLLIGAMVALWSSYSRSALIAAIAAIAIVVLGVFAKHISKWVGLVGIIFVFVVAGGLFAARSTTFVSNVILHDNATTGAKSNSNEGHIESLQDGISHFVHQPFGAGIGSTGSASLYGPHPLIVENQFLFIAHEVGWLGLAMFICITFWILRGLWHRRDDWLALSVFASGFGLVLVGLLLPVWVDDTVAIVWWGLAAIALAGKESYGGKIDKKTKRTA